MQETNSIDLLNNFINAIQNMNSKNNTKHSINDCINLFFDNAYTRCTLDTIKFYKKSLKAILPVLQELNIYYMEDLDCLKMNSIVARFKASCKYKNNTINKFIDILKMISRYCYYNDITEFDHIAKFKKLKKDDIETITISDTNIKKIFNYLSTLDLKNHINFRNLLFIYLLRDTGARCNEIRYITISDLLFEENAIFLHTTKTKQFRKVYITDETIELLKKYIDEIKPINYIVCNVKTKELLDRSNLYTFIAKIRSECDIDKSISPHKWRHTLASNLIKLNINLENVRKLLGHTSLETTKKYLHIQDKEQQETILNALNKLK